MARNNLRAMRLGDRAFFYHSNVGKEIVGIVEVVREAYPDPTVEQGEKGEWVCTDMRAVAPMPVPVTLAQLKADPAFAELPLIRQSRLSVMPISAAHWQAICALGGLSMPQGR
jgi:predicted RNA-binding protein with PUA-like domain